MKKETINVYEKSNKQRPKWLLILKAFWDNTSNEEKEDNIMENRILSEEDKKALLKALKDTDKLGEDMFSKPNKKGKVSKDSIKKSLQTKEIDNSDEIKDNKKVKKDYKESEENGEEREI